MKKVIALVLALVIVVSTTVLVFAAGPDIGGGTGGDTITWDDIVNAGIVKGDLTGDKKVTAIDARKALQKALDSESVTADDLKVADFNNDGKISAYDARQILKIAAQ